MVNSNKEYDGTVAYSVWSTGAQYKSIGAQYKSIGDQYKSTGHLL